MWGPGTRMCVINGTTFCFAVSLLLVSSISKKCVIHTGTPRHIDYAAVLEDLQSIEGVRLAHSLYIWSLTLNKSALAAHLAVGKYRNICLYTWCPEWSENFVGIAYIVTTFLVNLESYLMPTCVLTRSIFCAQILTEYIFRKWLTRHPRC